MKKGLTEYWIFSALRKCARRILTVTRLSWHRTSGLKFFPERPMAFFLYSKCLSKTVNIYFKILGQVNNDNALRAMESQCGLYRQTGILFAFEFWTGLPDIFKSASTKDFQQTQQIHAPSVLPGWFKSFWLTWLNTCISVIAFSLTNIVLFDEENPSIMCS